MNALSPRFSSPYSLRSAPGFYGSLKHFSDAALQFCEEIAGSMLDGHMALQQAGDPDRLRSRGEYAVELLTLGILRRIYGDLALHTADSTIRRMERLWALRMGDAARKPKADKARALLFRDMLHQRHSFAQFPNDSKLCAWLKATGEFHQEALRIQTWLAGTGVFWSAQELVECSGQLADWFISHSQEALGAWTTGVHSQVRQALAQEAAREDLLLITRPEPLYHLNMVGAEIMNRGFRSGFDARPHKVLLVPGCMRLHSETRCQAKQYGLDMECTQCHPECEVGKLQNLAERRNFQVRIVPHASSFTAWLEHWQKDKTSALIAAACPLHLVSGGYEMRALGLEAQCILLEYSGCRKHWDSHGTPTRLDHNRLLEIMGASINSL